MNDRLRILCLLAIPGFLALAGQCQQRPDPDFDARVSRPAWARGAGPVVAIDEGHGNFHTLAGNYSPLARLLENDGWRVCSLAGPITAGALDSLSVLVIANALAPEGQGEAFLPAECDLLESWVTGGGCLLLVADHAPFGGAATGLAGRFGIRMGGGWVFSSGETGMRTLLDFTPDSGLARDHFITRGRDSLETVTRVRSFTGQSLEGPPEAVVLLRLDSRAREAGTLEDLQAEAAALADPEAGVEYGTRSHPVGGRAQALALSHGAGRVVVLGEAAMLSAQVVESPAASGAGRFLAGMNVPGIDNRQWALSLFRWLAGADRTGQPGGWPQPQHDTSGHPGKGTP